MNSHCSQRVFNYRVNAEDRIDHVSSEWLDFARENDASDLDSEAVIGQPIFHFVSNEETRHLYEMILDRVRSRGNEVRVPFRCDGPSVRRFMELEVSPGPHGQVLFQGRIVREEDRPPVPLLDSSINREDDFLKICSWCKRVQAEGEWLEVELAVERLELFSSQHLPQLTHGICEDCGISLRRRIKGTKHREQRPWS
jgi:hypothetical protein